MAKKILSNATKITENPTDLKVSLKFVRLVSSMTELILDEGSPPKHMWFRAESAVGELIPSGRVFDVPVRLTATQKWLSSKGKESNSKVTAECSYEIVFTASRQPTEEESKLITEMGVRCGWPYVRAFIQHVTSQMGLPLAPLPLLQVTGSEMAFVTPVK